MDLDKIKQMIRLHIAARTYDPPHTTDMPPPSECKDCHLNAPAHKQWCPTVFLLVILDKLEGL